MSRLSEQEVTLIQRARRVADGEATDFESAQAEGRRLRAGAMVRMIAHAVDFVTRVTGLKLLIETVIRPIRQAMKRQATLEQVRRLDDRMLQDIGLDRGMINGYAGDLGASEALEALPALIARFRRWRETRATIRQLEALDDYLLADIGLERAEIARTVREAMRAGAAEDVRRTGVKDLIDQIDRSAAGSYRRNATLKVSRRIARLEGTETPKIEFYEVRA